MKYPTLIAVHDAQDANDFECLKAWHRELPAPRSGLQHDVLHAIENALYALGQIEKPEYAEAGSLFEIGGEG